MQSHLIDEDLGGTDSSPLSSYPATPKLSAEISSTPPATPGRLEAPTAPLPAVAKHDLASHPVDGSSSKDSTPTKKRRGPIAGPVHKVSKELKKMFK
ncbi:hypothetical protein APUTEX25_002479 [Auxenochlorella protothecoides]|uniref:Uncharacterized protein n=1 Tax=Auxenochlorella protothecoides TaxID=3075 RepID=A0A3M7L281_AUXPR|nr:hypothetical protein APUTEX25_002479 [Auxenochlorella protothecoides]|eukprot:RMZ56289.1 hypothetical protein APUTEX25_002479 [Auxenochlorella protothecoides]